VVRATPFKLRLFVGNKTRFNDPQGIACVRLDACEDSSRTSDDDEITAYGVNSGDNCILYNRSMFSLGVYGLDKGHYRFKQPWGIAANARGDVYVADRGNAKVVRLFNSGAELKFVSLLGAPADQPGGLLEPRGVALDSRGNVYVTDSGLDRVMVFDARGQVTGMWEGFDGPDGIAVVDPGEKWSYYQQDGFAVVIDSLHQRVRKLSLAGEPMAEARASDWGVSEAFLGCVTLDYYNQILITDRNHGCIHKLDRNLNYLTSFGEPGSGDYQFDQPRGIAIYRRFGQLLVAEREGAQYMWVAVEVQRFSAKVVADSIWRDLHVDFQLTEPAYCDLDVMDNFGRLLARLSPGRRFGADAGHFAWGLTIPDKLPGDQSYPALPANYRPGQPLPTGDYVIRGRFRATYSSREHYNREVEAKFHLDW